MSKRILLLHTDLFPVSDEFSLALDGIDAIHCSVVGDDLNDEDWDDALRKILNADLVVTV